MLDPRYKLSFVTFALEDMYGKGDDDLERSEHMEEEKVTGLEIAENVKRAMKDLFNEYKKKFTIQESATPNSGVMSSQAADFMDLDSDDTNLMTYKYKRRRTEGVIGIGDKSELEKYLSEDIEEASNKFDILMWWKVNSARFLILARIARDVLSIPVSTVASESAFSAEGHILDAFRSSLSPNMVETLFYT